MSRQPLGKTWMRRIADVVNEPIVRAWTFAGNWHSFVTADHRHGEIHAIELTVEWLDDLDCRSTKCGRLWSGQQRMFSYKECVFPDETRRANRYRFRKAEGEWKTPNPHIDRRIWNKQRPGPGQVLALMIDGKMNGTEMECIFCHRPVMLWRGFLYNMDGTDHPPSTCPGLTSPTPSPASGRYMVQPGKYLMSGTLIYGAPVVGEEHDSGRYEHPTQTGEIRMELDLPPGSS